MTHDHTEALAPHSEALRTWINLLRKGYAKRTEGLCPGCAINEYVSRLFDEAVEAAAFIGADPRDLFQMLCDAINSRTDDEVRH